MHTISSALCHELLFTVQGPLPPLSISMRYDVTRAEAGSQIYKLLDPRLRGDDIGGRGMVMVEVR